MVLNLKVGCCGLAGLSLTRYAEVFDVVELQSTFYRLPRLETARRWRDSVPERFEFTVKVFQGVTHPASSPTWRRAGGQKPRSNLERYGHLQSTEECIKSWHSTIDVCRSLNASFCVVQLPPSFNLTDRHIRAVTEFFSRVEKRDLKIGIELRHRSWREDPERLASTLNAASLIHIVDPLVEEPAVHSYTQYFRLHGLGPRLYSYKYTDQDLEELKQVISKLKPSECYVMFNNVSMREDALRLRRLVER